MTGTLNVRGVPCKNNDFPVSIAATALLPFTRWTAVIGPVSASPPADYADWLGAAEVVSDTSAPIETRTKGPGGIALSATFLGLALYSATAGDPCWLGLFGAITPVAGDAPMVVVRMADIALVP